MRHKHLQSRLEILHEKLAAWLGKGCAVAWPSTLLGLAGMVFLLRRFAHLKQHSPPLHATVILLLPTSLPSKLLHE